MPPVATWITRFRNERVLALKIGKCTEASRNSIIWGRFSALVFSAPHGRGTVGMELTTDESDGLG